MWQPIAIVVIALIVRVAYNLFLEHRVCHFGDAFYFLNTGNSLLALIQQSHSVKELISTLVHQHNSSLTGLRTMMSLSLADRLLIDGPVYPAHLALIEWVMNVKTQAPVFDSLCLPLSIFNSIIDSVSCLLIYRLGKIAFDRRTGLIAGIIFALYPPAIINTQHCYSEPYAYFILLFFLNACFDESTERKRALFSWFLVGLLAGLTMLAKPIFVLIPLVIGTYFLALGFVKKKKPPVKDLVALFAGLFVFLGPWLWFTHAVTGNFSIFVSRAPSYNLYLGNHLATDGWRAWPEAELIPSDTKQAALAIAEQAAHKPLKFIALELKKLTRLWVGVWNEYQYSLFGITLEIQTIWHDLLLLLGGIGTLLVLFGQKRFSHSWNCAFLLGSIIGLHYIYCAFEPISRYNITAMPAVILFASFAISHARANKLLLPALLTITYAVFLFSILARSYELKPLFAGLLTIEQMSLLPWIQAAAWILLFVLLVFFAKRWLDRALDNKTRKLSNLTLGTICFVSVLVTLACVVADPSWREWSRSFKLTSETAVQTIALPSLNTDTPSPTSYILVDLTSTASLPPLHLKLNDEEQLHPALPWAIVRGISPIALQVLAIQGQGMGRDLKTFRQWWAFPVPTSSLRFGGTNVVSLSPAAPQVTDSISFFGDYVSRINGTMRQPSFTRISWPKGFGTYDHLDSRVYEPVGFQGKINGIEQRGAQYRIRIVVPFSKSTAASKSPAELPSFQLVPADKPRALVGKDLTTMMITKNPISLPNNLPSGSLFYIYCDLKGFENPGNAYLSVDFTGVDGDKPGHWNSLWQPASITTYPEWRSASFADIIPDNVLRWKDLRVRVLASPFTPDQLFLKKKQALSKDGAIRDVNFAILPPLEIPTDADWRIY